MDEMKAGLYEKVINEQLEKVLNEVPDNCKYIEKIDSAEASSILTNYISTVIKKKLDGYEEESLEKQIELINKIAVVLSENSDEEYQVSENPKQLLSLLSTNDYEVMIGTKTAKKVSRPETSIARSSLFTGAIKEPQMISELKKEIESSDRIDMLVSFIRWSGLRELIVELKKFTQRGGKLRVITTSYMGATEVKSVEELNKLPNTTIKVSYDTNRTRLHAKSYIFHRETGYTTAYIGSSNISKAALSSGLEWNVKITEQDMLDVLEKVNASFESYWNTPEFETYNESDKGRLVKALNLENNETTQGGFSFLFDLNPYTYQQEILDNLKAERVVRGRNHNLVVAATGTGKTLIAAFDYREYCKKNPRKENKLLFIAHREDILKQSMAAFRAVLKDPNFGELFVGQHRPDGLEHLFVSIQTITSQRLYEIIDAEYYDYIVIDEFHHAAADTYNAVLEHFKPCILLGLTATPERHDGKDILKYFDGSIAAEIRLPEAIDRKLLCPFQYFGIADTVDLDDIQWRKGGYDVNQLTNVYAIDRTIAEKRAASIIVAIERYVADMEKVCGLGFCVSKEHARFMSDYFNVHGIPSINLDADSSERVREKAKKDLKNNIINYIFTVDLYNEGVDIPEVNTVLFLRPTESLTVFLQQLGRGLRLYDGKDCLTVLDFIGQANKKYSFEQKFEALLYDRNHSIKHEIEHGFVSLPKGCYIELEEKPRTIILENIKQSFGNKNALVSKIRTFTDDSDRELNLENFLKYYQLSKKTIYQKYSFVRLCVEAGVRQEFEEPLETIITKALPKIARIDSRRWIEFLLKNLSDISVEKIKEMSDLEKKMMQMFYITIWNTAADWDCEETINNIQELVESTNMLAEIIQLLQYNLEHIDFVDEYCDLGFDCPLDVYCTYTREQLLSAFEYYNWSSVQGGVIWLPQKRIDVLMNTLNKSEKDYSPSTMYRDYSINEELFHWESQNKTSETSTVGARYINHKQQGSKVLLFVREHRKDEYGTAPYMFLGTANYVSHKGNKPMSIIWKLDKKIPAKFIKKTNKLVVG
ncbi:DUF3427 domain-containing protein [Pseudobutyrivibrio xylanivorans]|uniref:Helicase conserved C-terminal domain-containing protein n=1 Tax=Pseudobutyrivibrio xylanivorans DSM 14809 TaxID=1123012 RepID=A0A1M6CSR9_PSEXY|nr:DUF3427 domain-containing protein [Pseudobutyrivibrio xylanivorans]SHI64135.1 Helicase conserved C-terminal domain-containing protein [Pseudobutyrivibrio xylanivorans DSM 14809]